MTTEQNGPAFQGAMTAAQADALVEAMWQWIVESAIPIWDKSTVAAIICDAAHADITLQPLHEAYGRKVGYQVKP